MPAPLLLALALSAPPQEWTALELPAASLERPSAPRPPALLDGVHVLIDPGRDERRAGTEPLLPPPRVAQVLEAEARRAGRALEVYPSAPPLVVRGDAPTVAWARDLLAGLDAAAGRARITLDVALAPRGAADGDDAALAGEGARTWSVECASGEELALGDRRRRTFVASYDVEVATDSGVATPMLGRVELGETVHLRAARLQGGAAVHVVGLLDLAELEDVLDFDPGTPDLGIVEEPRVRSAQIAFSGVVRGDEALTVELSGLPLSRPEWTLEVRARCQPEPLDPPPAGWRLVDLALLAEAPRALPAFGPGAGLDYAELSAVGGGAKAISPGGLLGMVEAALRRGTRGGSPIWSTERTLLVPAAEADAWAALEGLVGALETGRARSGRVELRHGGLRARLPVAAGEALRVVVGVERTWLVGYDSQIAPDAWMPAPEVERAFDGLALQGRCDGDRLTWSALLAGTPESVVRSRDDAQLGALQLPSRTARGASGEARAGAGLRTALEARGGAPAVELGFEFP